MNAADIIPEPEAPVPPKKSMSAKEPPAFKWKLAGYVDGLTVTLLKAVDQAEVEAQLERLQAEGYYRDLTVYPIDAKVPPDPMAAKFAKERKAAERAAAPAKGAKAAHRPVKASAAKPAPAKAKPKPKPVKPAARKPAAPAKKKAAKPPKPVARGKPAKKKTSSRK